MISMGEKPLEQGAFMCVEREEEEEEEEEEETSLCVYHLKSSLSSSIRCSIISALVRVPSVRSASLFFRA